ncbi:MAG TPA: hypothetical protein VG870_12255 [Chitinophagaceae bacterium]|nr:hypothetical protein [Chitinophagaceae bacterium]
MTFCREYFRCRPVRGAVIALLLLAAQAGRAQRLDSTLGIYADQYSQERAYIHYDKSAYSPGETIWFKAYLMEDIFPADESKTFYIDWYDQGGKLISHTVSPLVDATTFGQFEVPASYPGTVLHVKAYTRWMLNFDTAFIYTKDIRILSPNPPASSSRSVPAATLQFFPEGGDAVAGIPNRIAFKANDPWGRPVGLRGVVTDDKGRLVDSLRVQHDGMGAFFLIPQPGLTYQARWKDDRGAAHVTPLPAIKPGGVTLQVTGTGERRIVSVHATPDAAATIRTIHVLGTVQQHEVFKISRDISSGTAGVVVPTEALPNGILTITVFDDRWNALAERITYVHNLQYFFQPTMEVQHWGLSKRARNEVLLTIPDSLQADLSVAVTDAAIGTDSSENILSRLFLTGDLKGYVHDPAYYFSDTTETIRQHLDLVMLTHGWRRFRWEDVVQGRLPTIAYPRDTAYLSLSGQVFGVLPTQLGSAGTIFMILKQRDSASHLVIAPVTRNGTFNDPATIFFDSAHVYYQFPKATGLGDAEVKFMVDRLPPLGYHPLPGGSYLSLQGSSAADLRQYKLTEEAVGLEQLTRMKVLENVTVTAKKKSPLQVMDENYTSGLFEGGDAYQFDLLNDPIARGYNNIFQYLQGKVAGLQISVNGNNVSLSWRGGTPQLFLNEMQADPDLLSTVNVSDVAYIKVFRPPFIGGFGSGEGAIAIYTRKGNDIKQPPGKGMNNSLVTGYTPVRQFYSPNYDHFDQRNEQRDTRTTIYWNPRIQLTPQKRQVLLVFYNTDVTESFRVIIEGMTRDGRLAHLEQVME